MGIRIYLFENSIFIPQSRPFMEEGNILIYLLVINIIVDLTNS
jgi:hypothetical protein